MHHAPKTHRRRCGGGVAAVWRNDMLRSLMVDTKRRRATYQDVLDAPEHMVAEIFDGELVLPPDWVCEVLSTSTERYDRGK